MSLRCSRSVVLPVPAGTTAFFSIHRFGASSESVQPDDHPPLGRDGHFVKHPALNLKGQKVAVCGAGGFIGGHLVKYLLDNGVEVVRAVDVKPLDEWYQVTPGIEN